MSDQTPDSTASGEARPGPGQPRPPDQSQRPGPGQPPRIVLAIGLPGSGKSAWFKKKSIVPLSSDQLRIILADNQHEQGFQADIFRALRYLLEVRLDLNRPLTYIDATNLVREHRRDFIEIAQRRNCSIEALFFDVPLGVCLARNRNRPRQVPEDVMQKMAANLEPPTLEEGFTRIVRVGKDGKVFEDVYSSLAGS